MSGWRLVGRVPWDLVASVGTEAESIAAWTAQRDALWDRCARLARERSAPKPPPPVPLVLVPTQRQRAEGVRLVDARDDQMPAACRKLVEAARAAGWTSVRVTYAHALMPPKRGGEDWWDNHSVALRLVDAERRISAWGCWSNGKWDSGQVARPGTLAAVGARDFAGVARGLLAAVDASLDTQAPILVGSGV